MPLPPPECQRHLFDKPPTSAQLSALLPAPRADHLSYATREDVFEVTISPRPIWYLMPGLVWFGIVVMVTPWTAALWGGQFMGWPRWLALVLVIWGVVLPVALVVLSWVTQRRHAGESVVVVDPAAGTMVLPNRGRRITADQLFQVVEIIRWAADRRRWRPIVQTALVVLVEQGGFEVVPLVTQVRPSRFAMPLADRLAEVFDAPLLRVQLDAQHSREA